MKVSINFPTIASIIEFEPFLGDDMEKYQEQFDLWYKYNFEPYRGEQNKDGKYHKIFDENVVIDWIKEVAPESNPSVLVEEIKLEEVDSSLPGLYF